MPGHADSSHAKNFSIIHEADDPVVILAPAYDILSTISLRLTDPAGNPMEADPRMGQRVGGQRDIREVTSCDLVAEGVKWGIRRAAAGKIVHETLDPS